MVLRIVFRLVCLVLTALCLAIGAAVVEPWLSLAAGPASILVWLAAFRWPSTWMPSLALLVCVSLAAAGLIAGAAPVLMLLAAILALVDWDLAFLGQAVDPGSTGVALLEKKHYQNLLLAIGLALLVIFIGRVVRIQIPFVAMLLLVTLAFLGIGRFWKTLSD
jgi:hypothetical protein